ncbi:hypothetical protein [Streptomyces sp. TS71-3]|uniref:hypothetical protein n=1 Tax=Streptomyces sp. TS71-3 TaxID=2733862 RepID=UPI001B1B3264|nr:hypothetical protein [Streptomyces sp. TS71-3]GHJ38675.1 hypothetical protein Sm713_42840 [Streptomyces sp. TS71-3]
MPTPRTPQPAPAAAQAAPPVGPAAVARLVRDAARRQAPGPPGPKARRAWRRLVRLCAAGDPEAQDALRELAARPPAAPGALSDEDVLHVLASAPGEDADRAAYLTLVGQRAQRQALDPDGTLLALAYRAAAPDVRTRLRTLLSADGDVVRVVVTGERRERLAELGHDELDYLGRHLAERGDWHELRRLAADLPLAGAAAVARLLPERERAEGELDGGAGELLRALAARSPDRVRAVVDRLPRRHLTAQHVGKDAVCVSFSPDGAEMAVSHAQWRTDDDARDSLDRYRPHKVHIDVLNLGTGEAERRFTGASDRLWEHPILHRGTDVVLRGTLHDDDLLRVHPGGHDRQPLGSTGAFRPEGPWRSSTGALMVTATGLAFADRGTGELRHVPVALGAGPAWPAVLGAPSAAGAGGAASGQAPSTSEGRVRGGVVLATLPSEGLLALLGGAGIHLLDERGHLLHRTPEDFAPGVADLVHPALAFLAPTTVAVHYYGREPGAPDPDQFTDVWEFPPDGAAHRTAHHRGPVRERWPWQEWQERFAQGLCPGDDFVRRIYTSHPNPFWDIDEDTPWLQRWTGPNPPAIAGTALVFHGMGPYGDMFVTGAQSAGYGHHLFVHSPHLPAARTLLEQPLAHCTPGDLRNATRLRARIGDPEVRDLLGLLGSGLSERFGGEIALGSGESSATGPAGPTDLALGGQGRGEGREAAG